MNRKQLGGASVAIITPFTPQGDVDHSALAKLVETLIEGGITGIVACGTTGEAATLSEEERVAVVTTCLKQANKRATVVAGVSTNCTRVAVESARRYAEIGADALLVVAPYYNKPNQEGLFQHFMAVAEAVDLPQIVYNVPGRTACKISAETLGRLSQHPNIVATKDATGDLVFASETIEACGDDLLLLSGDDHTLLPFMALGGAGCISVVGNVAPRLLSDLVKACAADDMPKARKLHFQMAPLSRLMFCDTNPIPVKISVALQHGFSTNLRLPLVSMDEAATATLRENLQTLGAL